MPCCMWGFLFVFFYCGDYLFIYLFFIAQSEVWFCELTYSFGTWSCWLTGFISMYMWARIQLIYCQVLFGGKYMLVSV